MNCLILDYETRASADLRKRGAYNYARHAETSLLCVAWRRIEEGKAGPVRSWTPFIKSAPPADLIAALMDPSGRIIAHNVFFERMITRYVLTRYFPNAGLEAIPASRWDCTAARAAALALPRNLAGACEALGLPVQKDMDGRRLLLKMCKPRKATQNNSARWHETPEDIARLIQYCKTDVEAETGLHFALPELSAAERRVWLLDQKINERGFHIDTALIDAASILIHEQTQAINEEIEEITMGTVSTAAQREGMLGWLLACGESLPDLTAGTVKTALEGAAVSPVARRLLELRQMASKTSTAKYAAFRARCGEGDRVRDNLMYHGASTGRWTGTGVQPQNFPRGSVRNTEQAAAIVKERDLEMLRLLYGSPLDVLASTLRAVITATPGYELFCGDYAAIEARVLLWLAKDEGGLAIFEKGLDPYIVMAARIYNVEYSAVTKFQRQVGKMAVLGLGYGMGPVKFVESCKTMGGVEITEELAESVVRIYRVVHRDVTELWRRTEKAAIYAAQTGTRVTVNGVAWLVEGRILYAELPSGRRLAYYGPEVRLRKTPWGEDKPALYHYGVNPVTRKWTLDGTYGGRLVENLVQAIARDFMASAMLRLEATGYEILLSVHDEILAERPIGTGTLSEFERLMRVVPLWGRGCPIDTSGFKALRYRK